MHEDTAERIAAAAPAEVRETFLRAAIPGFGQALDTVRGTPGRIKRYNARQAKRVVALVDDPGQLAEISAHEKRLTVREALRANPAWQRGPHETNCIHCREMPIVPTTDMLHLERILGDRDTRLQELGTTNLCEEQVMRTIAAAPAMAQPRLWAIGFNHNLRYSARAHVEHAAGRIVVEGDPVPEWGGHNAIALVRLLDAEPVATPLLLDLAVRVRHIPKTWSISDAEWTRVVLDAPERALACGRKAPLDVITANWGALPSASRIQALGQVEEQPQLEELLALLTPADINEANTNERHGTVVVDILHRFPALSDPRRLGVISMLSRKSIGTYLLGRFGVGPRLDEIGDVLTLYTMGMRVPSYRALIENAARTEESHENRVARRALIDALVLVAPPRELFSGDHRISAAAHAYTWERLTDPAAVAAFASLFEEWQGTLPDLVSAAAGLAT